MNSVLGGEKGREVLPAREAYGGNIQCHLDFEKEVLNNRKHFCCQQHLAKGLYL